MPEYYYTHDIHGALAKLNHIVEPCKKEMRIRMWENAERETLLLQLYKSVNGEGYGTMNEITMGDILSVDVIEEYIINMIQKFLAEVENKECFEFGATEVIL